ncbi:MAG: ABC transporter permease [Clostridiales bacterium]|jgi:ABC-2 type transport system permease protein|nr:ABC transporter permease [Clostridiales bacterium]
MKFINLLKKELRELINAQMIIGLVVSMSLLVLIGGIMGDAIEDAVSNSGDVYICDQDNTEFTKRVIENLNAMGYNVNEKSVTKEDSVEILEELNINSLIIIPKGFTEGILKNNAASELEYISRIKSTSAMASLRDGSTSAIESIKSIISNLLMQEGYGLSEADITVLENPVNLKEVTVVDKKSANVSASTIIGMASTQGMIVPIVIFILVMFTSQMIISTISTEKIDKTLETLLSAPVSRLSVLGAKMLAAAIVALINAVAYMIAFSSYMSGMLGSTLDTTAVIGEALTMSDILKELGLKLTAGGYILLGLQMFMTIMIALSVSLILGAMATDAKSAQTLVMPIMIFAMIPYMISLFMDVNSMSNIVKIFVWLIPFTHTFTAINNIMFGNWPVFWGGLAYQFVFFIVCMYFALKLFTSDKIFTISLNLGQKMKLKKVKKG